MTGQVAEHRGANDNAAEALRLDRQVCFPLYAATNLLNRAYGPVLRPLGLTYPQYLVMLVLWEQQPQSVGALGQRLYLDSGTLTPLLKRMESAGLVRRYRDPADERRVMIELTAAGRDLRDRALHVPHTLSRGRSESEVDALRVAVQQLVQLLASQTGTD